MHADEGPRGVLLALDLLNTLQVVEGGGADRLAAPAEAVSWLADRELGLERLERLRASPSDAAILLQEARRLRDAIGRAVEALRARARVPDDAVFGIDRVLASAHVVRRLKGEGDGLRLHGEVHGEHPIALLALVALGAAELLTSVEPKRVRRCAAERCREWFVDTSKGGRRRWCSMERCGNRAKVAKHRRRARQTRRAAGS